VVYLGDGFTSAPGGLSKYCQYAGAGVAIRQKVAITAPSLMEVNTRESMLPHMSRGQGTHRVRGGYSAGCGSP